MREQRHGGGGGGGGRGGRGDEQCNRMNSITFYHYTIQRIVST